MEIHRFRATAPPPRPAEPPVRCIAGECVWVRWALREGETIDTPRARLLRAYLSDLSGLCRCPRRRFSRWT